MNSDASPGSAGSLARVVSLGGLEARAPRRQDDRDDEASKTTSETAQSGGAISHKHPLGEFPRLLEHVHV
jgi:hypothetical protein